MIKYYRIVDNLRPKQNVAIGAINKSEAMDIGASHLKTTNIRIKLLKNKPKQVDGFSPVAARKYREKHE